MRGLDSYLLELKLLRDKIESFDAYPFSIHAIRELKEIEFHPKVTFLVGENGSGKSTLLEAIAVSLGLNPEGGSKNFNFGTRKPTSINNLPPLKTEPNA
jgi:predicted ATPase